MYLSTIRRWWLINEKRRTVFYKGDRNTALEQGKKNFKQYLQKIRCRLSTLVNEIQVISLNTGVGPKFIISD